MSKASWEHTDNASETEWYSELPGFRPDHPRLKIFLKNLAQKKMMAPYLISAEFNGVREVFEPWISLLLDEGSSMRFYGIYLPGFTVEEPFVRPSICLRRGIWNGSLDYEAFYRASDKARYVAQEQAVSLSILYSSPATISSLFNQSKQGVDIFRQGVKLELTEKPKNNRQNIICDLWDDSIHYVLSYSPLAKKNDALENWVDQWIDAMDQLDFSPGYRPDGASRISYRESLADWMRYFQRF